MNILYFLYKFEHLFEPNLIGHILYFMNPWSQPHWSQFLRAASSPKVNVGVVGAGTARVFEEAMQSAEGSLHVTFTPSKGSLTVYLQFLFSPF